MHSYRSYFKLLQNQYLTHLCHHHQHHPLLCCCSCCSCCRSLSASIKPSENSPLIQYISNILLIWNQDSYGPWMGIRSFFCTFRVMGTKPFSVIISKMRPAANIGCLIQVLPNISMKHKTILACSKNTRTPLPVHLIHVLLY
jgi:hypothetical protein